MQRALAASAGDITYDESQCFGLPERRWPALSGKIAYGWMRLLQHADGAACPPGRRLGHKPVIQQAIGSREPQNGFRFGPRCGRAAGLPGNGHHIGDALGNIDNPAAFRAIAEHFYDRHGIAPAP
jgi:hypothetical protein